MSDKEKAGFELRLNAFTLRLGYEGDPKYVHDVIVACAAAARGVVERRQSAGVVASESPEQHGEVQRLQEKLKRAREVVARFSGLKPEELRSVSGLVADARAALQMFDQGEHTPPPEREPDIKATMP